MNTSTNKLFLWFMAGALVFLCAGLFGFTVDAYGNPVDTQDQNHQKVTSSNSNESQPKIVCPMEWTSPVSSSNAGEMPATGAVSFDWTDHPTTSDYDLTVFTPNGSPVSYDVDGSSKDLFLENYSQIGNYQVIVTALDANGDPMCSIAMSFSMPAVVEGVKEKANNNEEDEAEPSAVIPSNPVANPSQPQPTPTEVEIR